jgi:hypothetical protein
VNLTPLSVREAEVNLTPLSVLRARDVPGKNVRGVILTLME